MTRSRSIYLALLACLLAPTAANADLIQFSWINNGTSGALVSGSGYWVIDDSDIASGFGNYKAKITDFSFDWVTTNNTFNVSTANGDIVKRAFLNFDNSFNLIGFDVCFTSLAADATNICSAAAERPLILVKTTLWGATGGDDDQNSSQNNANFAEFPQTVTASPLSVPEPGTLALLGLGLVGMAARRRKPV